MAHGRGEDDSGFGGSNQGFSGGGGGPGPEKERESRSSFANKDAGVGIGVQGRPGRAGGGNDTSPGGSGGGNDPKGSALGSQNLKSSKPGTKSGAISALAELSKTVANAKTLSRTPANIRDLANSYDPFGEDRPPRASFLGAKTNPIPPGYGEVAVKQPGDWLSTQVNKAKVGKSLLFNAMPGGWTIAAGNWLDVHATPVLRKWIGAATPEEVKWNREQQKKRGDGDPRKSPTVIPSRIIAAANNNPSLATDFGEPTRNKLRRARRQVTRLA